MPKPYDPTDELKKANEKVKKEQNKDAQREEGSDGKVHSAC